MMKLLVLPIMIVGLAGCAANSASQPAAQANDCSRLSGAALADCQKSVQPASQSLEQPFKMVKPKPVNGKAGANKGSNRM